MSGITWEWLRERCAKGDETELVERFDIEVGDTVISSHYGRREVVKVRKGNDHNYSVWLGFGTYGNGRWLCEQYDGKTQILRVVKQEEV